MKRLDHDAVAAFEAREGVDVEFIESGPRPQGEEHCFADGLFGPVGAVRWPERGHPLDPQDEMLAFLGEEGSEEHAAEASHAGRERWSKVALLREGQAKREEHGHQERSRRPRASH